MRWLDLYWMKNKDWWKFENGCTIIKDTAPQDAQESYNRYLLQNGLDCLYELSRYQDKLLRLDDGLSTPDILYLCRYFETIKSEISRATSVLEGVHLFRTCLKDPRIVSLLRKYNLQRY